MYQWHSAHKKGSYQMQVENNLRKEVESHLLLIFLETAYYVPQELLPTFSLIFLKTFTSGNANFLTLCRFLLFCSLLDSTCSSHISFDVFIQVDYERSILIFRYHISFSLNPPNLLTCYIKKKLFLDLSVLDTKNSAFNKFASKKYGKMKWKWPAEDGRLFDSFGWRLVLIDSSAKKLKWRQTQCIEILIYLLYDLV